MRTLVIDTEAPTVPGPPQGRWTYADWEALPDDGKRYEVIDGVLYMTTAPSNFHQWIQLRFYRYLGMLAEDQGLGYMFTAPIGVLMPGCEPVQPDVIFVQRSNRAIIHDRRIRGVPDLIVEILSPSNAVYDTQVKLVAYALVGVPEYAIVDPRSRSLDRYWLHSPGRYNGPMTFSEADSLSFDCLPGVTLQIANLFADAPDTTL